MLSLRYLLFEDSLIDVLDIATTRDSWAIFSVVRIARGVLQQLKKCLPLVCHVMLVLRFHRILLLGVAASGVNGLDLILLDDFPPWLLLCPRLASMLGAVIVSLNVDCLSRFPPVRVAHRSLC